jgi:uncharacterized protein DUF664
MTGPDMKAELHGYLRSAREAVLWKLDGLSEYDVRRPVVPGRRISSASSSTARRA